MSGGVEDPKSDRPALPRDLFRPQRAASTPAIPVVVTPDYGDQTAKAVTATAEVDQRSSGAAAGAPAPGQRGKAKTNSSRNPFDGYGERTSSRPYALRLPDAIDLVLRQLAAEERTHPLRIIDRILHDHLKRAGRLPPLNRT